MNRKSLKCICTLALVGIISSANLTTVFGAIDKILIQTENESLVQYDRKELQKSQIQKLMGGEGKLYINYMKDLMSGKLLSYHDNKKNDYIDASKVNRAYRVSLMAGDPIKIDEYTASAREDEIYKVKNEIIQKKLNENGNIIEETIKPENKPNEDVNSSIKLERSNDGYYDGDFQVNFDGNIDEKSAENLENYKMQVTRKETGKTENVKLFEVKVRNKKACISTVRHLNLKEGDVVNLNISNVRYENGNNIDNMNITYKKEGNIDPLKSIDEDNCFYMSNYFDEFAIDFNKELLSMENDEYGYNKLSEGIDVVYKDGTKPEIEEINLASAHYGSKSYKNSSIFLKFVEPLKDDVIVTIRKGTVRDKDYQECDNIKIETNMKEQIIDRIKFTNRNTDIMDVLRSLIYVNLIEDKTPFEEYNSLSKINQNIVGNKFLDLIDERKLGYDYFEDLRNISKLLDESLKLCKNDIYNIINVDNAKELTQIMDNLRVEGFYNVEDAYKEKIAIKILNEKNNDLSKIEEILKDELVIIINEKLNEISKYEGKELDEKSLEEFREKFENVKENRQSLTCLGMEWREIQKKLIKNVYELEGDVDFENFKFNLQQDKLGNINYQDNILDNIYSKMSFKYKYGVKIISSDNDIVGIDGIVGRSNKDEVVNLTLDIYRYDDEYTDDKEVVNLKLDLKAN